MSGVFSAMAQNVKVPVADEYSVQVSFDGNWIALERFSAPYAVPYKFRWEHLPVQRAGWIGLIVTKVVAGGAQFDCEVSGVDDPPATAKPIFSVGIGSPARIVVSSFDGKHELSMVITKLGPD